MKNNIRITGGSLKGKKIPFDFKNSLRPTSSKLREVLFNWLQFEIQNFQCLDLFAGTGALGIEALSRGADKTIFIESNKKNYMALKNSLLELNLKSQSMLLFKDGLAWIKENDLSVFDLIFLDPPFDNNYETKVLEMLCKNKNLKSSCKIYIEFSKFSDIKLSNSYEILKEKIVGDVKALLVKIK
jgi:16S rRNA (guanine966-N2)-methyltransferase|tara:strand:+ start:639 stop:1193 length:555 start_codon:yes stop_codon:yes gene_type:complete